MQRERIDLLEASYAKVYQRYELQVQASSEMRTQLNQQGTSPSSGQNIEESHTNEQYKARCQALEQQISEISAKFSE